MAEFPFFPFWTDAYLADTGHLTTLEHGAYILLLIAMWRAGGSLPNDDKLLARYCRLTPGQWQRIKPTIIAFMEVSSDRITQGRLTDELDAVRQKTESQSKKAKAMWLKKKKSRHAEASARHKPTDANHNHNHNHINTPLPPKGDTDELFGRFWKAYPSRKGANPKKPAKDKFVLALKRGADAERIIGGARAYEASLGDKAGTEFVAQATTWLNQERWNDHEPLAEGKPFEVPEIWRNGCADLAKRAGTGPWARSWLYPCIPKIDGERLTLTAPTRFIADELRGRYAGEIEKIWAGPIEVKEAAA